jgi:long-subunit acyl-CoA synthetase (AMP-forming)
VFLTTKALHGDFAGNPNVHLGTVDQKHNNKQKTEVKKVERDRTMSSSQVNIATLSDQAKVEAIAVLMLTSGSIGRPKAVGITNRQINAAITGKASVSQLTATSFFLNWIEFDYVASLVEICLQALYLGAI